MQHDFRRPSDVLLSVNFRGAQVAVPKDRACRFRAELLANIRPGRVPQLPRTPAEFSPPFVGFLPPGFPFISGELFRKHPQLFRHAKRQFTAPDYRPRVAAGGVPLPGLALGGSAAVCSRPVAAGKWSQPFFRKLRTSPGFAVGGGKAERGLIPQQVGAEDILCAGADENDPLLAVVLSFVG